MLYQKDNWAEYLGKKILPNSWSPNRVPNFACCPKCFHMSSTNHWQSAYHCRSNWVPELFLPVTGITTSESHLSPQAKFHNPPKFPLPRPYIHCEKLVLLSTNLTPTDTHTFLHRTSHHQPLHSCYTKGKGHRRRFLSEDRKKVGHQGVYIRLVSDLPLILMPFLVFTLSPSQTYTTLEKKKQSYLPWLQDHLRNPEIMSWQDGSAGRHKPDNLGLMMEPM